MRFYVLILFCFVYSQADCVDGRYIDSLFDVEVTYGIQYGGNTSENILGSEFWQDLYMDIYEPAGDTLDDRPIIFFMYGGSFISGSTDSWDIVSLCNNYASRGYVAVAIDYRLTPSLIFNPISHFWNKSIII